ncbi:MAG: hypothetical protein GX061_01775 [Eubacteriaceae bacterium]|nr:hypothetical protein [Eubacteriaceae bacterium]
MANKSKKDDFGWGTLIFWAVFVGFLGKSGILAAMIISFLISLAIKDEKDKKQITKKPAADKETKATGARINYKVPPSPEETLSVQAKKYDRLFGQVIGKTEEGEMKQDIIYIRKITSEIFAQAMEKENAASLSRFTSYYLPTTVKLLTTYTTLIEKPLRTAKIRGSMTEIEKVIKDIKAAFEKLYDEIITDTAADISAEISALQTVMDLDGLSGEIFSPTADTSEE